MSESMNASDRMTQRPRSRWWRRAAAIAVSVLLLATLVIVPATQGADDDLILYPLAPSNFGRVLRVSGIAEPGQKIRIEANKVVAARTVANESGDFAVAFVPKRGVNDVQAIEDGKRLYPSHSNVYRVRHDPPLAFDKVARGQPVTQDQAQSAKTQIVAFLAIAAPVITTPPASTTSNPITLSGMAPAGTTVNFYVNGRYTRQVVASGGGTFSTWVPLEDSLNSVYAVATDGVDTSPASNTVQTTYTNSISRTYSATTISAPTVWTAGSASTYTLNGTITINSTGALWIQPGVTVNVSGNYKLLASSGELAIRGTSASRVLLRPSTVACTETTTKRSDWAGIEVSGTTGRASTEYADVYCATNGIYFNGGTGSLRYSRFINNTTGARTQAANVASVIAPLISGDNEFKGSNNGIYILPNSRPTISGNNLITGNTYGINVDANSNAAQNPLPIVNGNSIYGNSSFNYYSQSFGNPDTTILDAKGNWWGTTDPSVIAASIRDRKATTAAPYVDFSGYLDGPGGVAAYAGNTLIGPVSATTTLPSGNYLLIGDVVVNSGVTLTLSSGAVIQSTAGRKILVSGNLQASGTSTQRVRFTSSNAYPASSDWTGIEVGLGGTVNLNYARIEYAANGVDFNAGQGVITHALIRFCDVGIYVRAKSNPTINQANEISNNNYGIYVVGASSAADNPLPVVNGNSLFANASYNYYAKSFATPRPTLDATGNWWGTAVGTGVTATIYTGATTSPTVNSSGFLSAAPMLPAMLVSGVAMSVQQAKPLVSTQPAAGVFTINRSGNVSFVVRRDEDNAIVRQWSQAYAASGQYAFTWDGRDDATNIVAPGLYRVIINATDGADDYVLDAPVPAGVAVPAGSAPSSYLPYRNESYRVSVTYPQPALASMQITPQGGTLFYPFKDVYYPAGTHWLYWDGRGPDGNIVTVPSAIWIADATIMRPTGVYVFSPTVAVTGTGTAPNIEVKSDPYFIASSYEQASKIVYRISQDANVRVTLLPPGISDPSHASAIVLVNTVFQPAKDSGGVSVDYTVEWKGYNSGDPNAMLISDNGAYTFAIEATVPGTSYKSLYRGVLNVVQ
jgi:hypothetical protein